MNPFKRFVSNIQASRKNKAIKKASYQRFQMLVQAMGEGGREASIITPEILEELYNQIKQPDKNNYKTYQAQIETIYKMYYGESNYGGELLRGLIDIQVAMLAGEGVNVMVFDSPEFLQMQKEEKKKKTLDISPTGPIGPDQQDLSDRTGPEEEIKDEKKEKVKEFINNISDWNKLEGEGLIEIAECGMMEGKVLLVINPIKKNGETIIKIEVFDFYSNKYVIKRKHGELTEVSYTNDTGKKTDIPVERCVFMQFSGSKKDYTKTPPKIANVLTQIENYSRAKYDLRKNNHLFGKSFLWFKTENPGDAQSIKDDLESKEFKVGRGGAGSGDPRLVSMAGGASTAINEERIMDIKDIATTMNFPIFFLNYPELMSNRAVADTMMEAVNQGSKKERLILQSGIKELIQKCMMLGVDQKVKGAINEPDMFEVNIPLITMDTLKQLVEVFLPLMDKKIISKKTVQGKVPGINPLEEDKQIEEETKENIINNPIVQGTINDVMAQKSADNQNASKMPSNNKQENMNANNIKK